MNSKFGDDFIQSFTYKERIEFTNQMIETNQMDRKYDLVTFGLDGTHCPIWKKGRENYKKLYSYKKKDTGYNILVRVIYL